MFTILPKEMLPWNGTHTQMHTKNSFYKAGYGRKMIAIQFPQEQGKRICFFWNWIFVVSHSAFPACSLR